MSSTDVEHMLARLRDEIDRAGYQSLAEASRAAGDETPQGLRDVVSGRKRCSVEYLMRLGAIGVDVTYVMTGQRISSSAEAPQADNPGNWWPADGEEDGPLEFFGQQIAKAAAREHDPALTVSSQSALVEVPLYDVEGAAGAGRSLEGEQVEGQLYFPEAQLAALGISPGQVAGVKVRGDSMEGTLADGDWVLVDLANRDPRREGVFLLWVSGERRIKRVQRLAGGALYLISDNEHYKPEMITPEQMGEVEILGRCEIRIGRVS